MTEMIDSVRRSICENYSFDEIGTDEFLVHTGMYYDDGDELHIVMKKMSDGVLLTDEGHTMMWLSYEDFTFTGTRRDLLDRYVEQNGVSLIDGCIQITVESPGHAGSALSSLIQTMLQVAGLRNLSRSNVASTFKEDVLSTFRESTLAELCEFKKEIPGKGGSVEADIFLRAERPVLIFVASGPGRAKDVLINLLMVQEADIGYRTVVVIDESSKISKRHRELIETHSERSIADPKDVLSVAEGLVKARFYACPRGFDARAHSVRTFLSMRQRFDVNICRPHGCCARAAGRVLRAPAALTRRMLNYRHQCDRKRSVKLLAAFAMMILCRRASSRSHRPRACNQHPL